MSTVEGRGRWMLPGVLILASAVTVWASPSPAAAPPDTVSITLDAMDSTLWGAIHAFAEQLEMNWAFDPLLDKSMKVTVPQLRAVPWRQAIDAFANGNALEAEITGSVIRIQPPGGGCPGAGLSSGESFTGKPVNLAGKDMDWRDLLRFLSGFAGLDVVFDPDVVRWKSNLYLTEVPWDQALDLLLREACLEGTIERGVIRVAGPIAQKDQ